MCRWVRRRGEGQRRVCEKVRKKEKERWCVEEKEKRS